MGTRSGCSRPVCLCVCERWVWTMLDTLVRTKFENKGNCVRILDRAQVLKASSFFPIYLDRAKTSICIAFAFLPLRACCRQLAAHRSQTHALEPVQPAASDREGEGGGVDQDVELEVDRAVLESL